MEEIEVKAEKRENANCVHICVYKHLHSFRDAPVGAGIHVSVCRLTSEEMKYRNIKLQHQHGAC